MNVKRKMPLIVRMLLFQTWVAGQVGPVEPRHPMASKTDTVSSKATRELAQWWLCLVPPLVPCLWPLALIVEGFFLRSLYR